MKATGFSLLEALVATSVITVGVASLAQLFVISAGANRAAGGTSIALLLAEAKMAELRAGPASVGLSPPGALSTDTAGYVDYLDAGGVPMDATSTAPPAGTVPAGAVYVRRWSIDALPAGPVNAIVLQVVVTRWQPSRGPGGRGDARLVSVKAQQVG